LFPLYPALSFCVFFGDAPAPPSFGAGAVSGKHRTVVQVPEIFLNQMALYTSKIRDFDTYARQDHGFSVRWDFSDDGVSHKIQNSKFGHFSQNFHNQRIFDVIV
jgi:hypothetical protein